MRTPYRSTDSEYGFHFEVSRFPHSTPDCASFSIVCIYVPRISADTVRLALDELLDLKDRLISLGDFSTTVSVGKSLLLVVVVIVEFRLLLLLFLFNFRRNLRFRIVAGSRLNEFKELL